MEHRTPTLTNEDSTRDSTDIEKAAQDGVDKALAWLKAQGAEYVRFEAPDVHGIAYNKAVPIRHFKRFATSGLNMWAGGTFMGPNGSIPHGVCEYFAKTANGDGYLFPDYSTMKMVPWSDNKVARVLCGIKWRNEGNWEELSQTRGICKQLLRTLKDKHGLELFSCFEFEFTMWKHQEKESEAHGSTVTFESEKYEPAWKAFRLFNGLNNAKYEDFMFKCEKQLLEAGVDMNTQNCEFGQGQMEWTMMPAFGVEGADNAYTFKNGMKEICQKDGTLASFMTSPYKGCANSGGHYNFSLWKTDANGEKIPAFYDASKPNGISDVMRYFCAGLLDHGKALTALASPTANCYRTRLQPGSWSPTNQTYGIQNRTAMLRWKTGKPSSTYVEFRTPSSAVNPYLCIAGVLAAGLDGLEKGAKNEELLAKAHTPVDGYSQPVSLPRSLEEAIKELEADEVMKSALGEQFMTLFRAAKADELSLEKNWDAEQATYFKMI